MSKEAMKLALEALKNSVDLVSNEAREAESLYGKYLSRLARVQGLVALEVAHQTAIKALEEALKQEQGEPVAKLFGTLPVYDTPQQRTWVGLTDVERSQLVILHHGWNEYGKAIEAKLKELNT